MILSVKVVPGRAKGSGYGSIWYDFYIRGSFGHQIRDCTEIVRSYGALKNPQNIVAAGTVALYTNGEWTLASEMSKIPTK